jgi:hypothetical protein
VLAIDVTATRTPRIVSHLNPAMASWRELMTDELVTCAERTGHGVEGRLRKRSRPERVG